MSFLCEIKPIFSVAQAMGCAPYKIIGNVKVKLSPIAIVHSLIMHSIYLYIIYYWLQMVSTRETKNISQLGVTRSIVVDFCMPICFISSLLQYREFYELVNRLNKFDSMVNLCPLPKKLSTTIIRRILVPLSLIISFTGGLLCVYVIDDDTYTFFNPNILVYSSFFTIVSLYSSILSSLLRRFQHINRLVNSDTSNHRFGDVNESHRKSIEIHEVWMYIHHLMNTTEKFAATFSFQLLIWIYLLAFNILTRLYSLWNVDITNKIPAPHFVDAATVIVCSFVLTKLIALCHLTAGEANSVGINVFSSNSKVFTGMQRVNSMLNQDTFAIAQYFELRRIDFCAAAGLVQIDLPLLETASIDFILMDIHKYQPPNTLST